MNLTLLFVQLDERRRCLGISKRSLACHLGIDPWTLNRYWKRKNMPAVMLFRMADALDIQIDFVFTPRSLQ